MKAISLRPVSAPTSRRHAAPTQVFEFRSVMTGRPMISNPSTHGRGVYEDLRAQAPQVLLNPGYAHGPGEPEEPDSMQDCPSFCFEYTIDFGELLEGTLFSLTRNQGAGMTSPMFTQNGIEDQDLYAIFLSFNHVVDSRNVPTGKAVVREPRRNGRVSYGVGNRPVELRRWTYLPEVPSLTEGT